MKKSKTKAVFLDRDGTLLRERGYLSRPKNFHFYKSVFPALRLLQKNGYKLVIITNQSGIGRGYFSETQLKRVHDALRLSLRKKGVRIDRIYYCPHVPNAGCACRKPRPGMIQKAKRDLNIDLSSSYLIGDQTRDIQLAQNVRVKGILVLTGFGRSARREAAKHSTKVATNLMTAGRWIVDDAQRP
jgi:D,D-heptose 1,7-bisphosphate phosphatase